MSNKNYSVHTDSPQLMTGRLCPFKLMMDPLKGTYDPVMKFHSLPPGHVTTGWVISNFPAFMIIYSVLRVVLTTFMMFLMKTGIYFEFLAKTPHRNNGFAL